MFNLDLERFWLSILVSYLDFVLVVWAVAPAVKHVDNETAFKKLKDGLLSATSGSIKESKDSE